jgi:hypothetical protein
MLRESNPGLARRFDIESAFVFQDYSDMQLLAILRKRLTAEGITASADALQAAVTVLAAQRDHPHMPFGNGGAVNNLLSAAIQRKAARGAAKSSVLEAADFSGSVPSLQ